MKWYVLMWLTLCVAASAEAQQMKVNDFTRLKRPLWNRSKVTVDKQRAIIDLLTTEKGFTFTANGKEAAEVAEGDGFITVKVPHQTRYLSIKHPQYGQLTWRVPVKFLKRKKHYRAILIATDPTQAYKPQQQWIVMDIEPHNAIVTMDSTVTLISNGQYAEMKALGSHTYTVEAPFYEAVTDSFLLTDTARVDLNIRLQPAYSYVTVDTPWEYGEIYVDGLYAGKGNATSRRIQEGQHRLTIYQYDMCIYDAPFTIGKAEKQDIKLTTKDFNPLPLKKPQPTADKPKNADLAKVVAAQTIMSQGTISKTPVTLKTGDADMEILVDRETVGKGQWSGELTKGFHIIHTMKDSIESPTTELWIVDSNPLEIDLAVPQTVMATLNIHSNVTGADIYINSVRVSTTPSLLTQLPSGKTYEVCLKKDGYKDAKAIVVPKGNEMTEVRIKMKQNRKKK